VFWYGLNFGTKTVNYMVPLNLFKGLIFTTPCVFSNMNNGFSGIAMFDDFYYSLFNVLLTTISVTTYIWLDQSVSLNYNQYKKTAKPSEKNLNYDPVKGQTLSLDTLFNREDWIAKNGISVNDDGSTNNLTDYYRYCRDSWIQTLIPQFIAWTIWGFVIGAMMYWFTYNQMGGVISSEG
jgi:hypothetical protein